MIKALFFDIDGTLVSFHTHRIPRSTVESLEKAKKKTNKRNKEVKNNDSYCENNINSFNRCTCASFRIFLSQ